MDISPVWGVKPIDVPWSVSVIQPASISDAICELCKFKNLLNLNFNKIMMIMRIMMISGITICWDVILDILKAFTIATGLEGIIVDL